MRKRVVRFVAAIIATTVGLMTGCARQATPNTPPSQQESQVPGAPTSKPLTEQEILEKEQTILDEATKLFSGKTDEGFYTSDITWLTDASENDSVAVVFACDDPTHGGWGVLGLSLKGSSGKDVQVDIPAYGENTGAERMLLYSMKELCEEVNISSPAEFTDFACGAWNGGRIAGLYYLNADLTAKMNTLLEEIKAANAISHGYNGNLSNPDASKEAVSVYQYLCETWGKNCLTGQMESTWMGSPDYEMNYIMEQTGKLPAIRGLDFMHNDFAGVVERSKDWWSKGGIVTICWHTGADFASGYNESQSTNIDWETAFTEGTEANQALIAGMDRAVPYLQELRDAGVPVLWRPFHELDGGWFWWSKGGSANFVKLWQLMYDHYTKDCGLNNLIWVYGYSHNGTNMDKWYPGDAYIDLIGADSYDPGANKDLYEKVVEIAAPGMPIVFHECGNIPTDAQMKEADAKWLFFMTWHTDYITDTKNNKIEDLKNIYNSDYYITLDELPKF